MGCPPLKLTCEPGLVPHGTIFLMGARSDAPPGQGWGKEEGRMQNDLACGCDGLTPTEIALMWQTAPPRMRFPPRVT
jgi:hypothetical protein